MDVAVKAVGVVAFFAGLVLIGPMLGLLTGSFVGWVAGMFWPHTLAILSHRLGLDVPPWRLGAMLGFLGGFFRTTVSSKSKSRRAAESDRERSWER